jgi:hypothetical protein
LIAKSLGPQGLSIPEKHQVGTERLYGLGLFGELSSLLTTEQSTVVTEEDQNHRTLGPQRAQADRVPPDLRRYTIRQLCRYEIQ